MKKILKPFLLLLIAALHSASYAQSNTAALIPMPNHIEKSKDNSTFQFNERTVINSSLPGNSFILQELTRIMEKHMQLSPAVDNKRNKNRIEINIDSTLKEKEHYTLKVDKRGISIKGGNPS
jgi:hexosaminidase